MRPSFTTHNVSNVALSYAEHASELGLRVMSGRVKTPDLNNIDVTKLGIAVRFPKLSRCASLLAAIPIVIALRAEEQVIGVAAQGIVAPVEHALVVTQCAVSNQIGQSRRTPSASVQAELAVTVIEQASRPGPALIGRGDRHTLPEIVNRIWMSSHV